MREREDRTGLQLCTVAKAQSMMVRLMVNLRIWLLFEISNMLVALLAKALAAYQPHFFLM